MGYFFSLALWLCTCVYQSTRGNEMPPFNHELNGFMENKIKLEFEIEKFQQQKKINTTLSVHWAWIKPIGNRPKIQWSKAKLHNAMRTCEPINSNNAPFQMHSISLERKLKTSMKLPRTRNVYLCALCFIPLNESDEDDDDEENTPNS